MAMPRSSIPKADRDHAYYVKNKDRISAYKRERYQKMKVHQRLKKFGITADEYDLLRASQNFSCAICGEHESNSRDGVLMVDHSHETGRVRGLLCNHCNLGLGHFRDNPVIVLKAANYLLDRVM